MGKRNRLQTLAESDHTESLTNLRLQARAPNPAEKKNNSQLLLQTSFVVLSQKRKKTSLRKSCLDGNQAFRKPILAKLDKTDIFEKVQSLELFLPRTLWGAKVTWAFLSKRVSRISSRVSRTIAWSS